MVEFRRFVVHTLVVCKYIILHEATPELRLGFGIVGWSMENKGGVK